MVQEISLTYMFLQPIIFPIRIVLAIFLVHAHMTLLLHACIKFYVTITWEETKTITNNKVSLIWFANSDNPS